MDAKIKGFLSLMSFEDGAWRFPGTVYDTFQALYSIASYDKTLLAGKPLGKIAALLISIESRPGGPYYSQFPKGPGKRKSGVCDQKTNKAIVRFLSLYGVKLPNVDQFLNGKGIKKGNNKRFNTQLNRIDTPSERAVMAKIHALLKERLAPLDGDFRKRARRVVDRTIKGNPDKQMSLMPYYVKKALGGKAAKIPEKMVVAMGLANIFFWTAFIIYDDFWDEDEAADPRLLPVANMFARNYIDFFNSIFPGENSFNTFFHRLMDELDGANAWETGRCRAKVARNIFHIPDSLPIYGDYLKKYCPTSGHILGPLALLLFSGYKIDSAEATHFLEYFKHYLIAMQMNDDMHDWEEDLHRGHISTVVDILLRDFSAKGNKRNKKKTIDLEKEMQELRKVFWFTTLPKIARKALYHTKKSRAALLAMRSISDRAPLEYFINFNQKIAEKALTEQKESVQFLNTYGKSYTS